MRGTLTACLAVSAVALVGLLSATSAFAVEHQAGQTDFACESGQDVCYYFGVQIGSNGFTVNGGNVKCTTATTTGVSTAGNGGTTAETVTGSAPPFTGTGKKDWTTHQVTVHPEYGGCTAFGQNVTVTTTGCNYLFTATSKTAGTATIECEAGKSIVIKGNTTGCTVTIGAQTPKNNAVDFTVEESPAAVKVTATVGTEPVEVGKETGIIYTSSGGACGASGKNGTYRGSTLTKCYKDEAHTNRVPCTSVETVEYENAEKLTGIE